jgi:hypothetical protein
MLTKTKVLVTTASATQTIPAAEYVTQVVGLAGGATSIAATEYSIIPAAPTSATEVQFTGQPGSPSTTLTFEAALTAAGVLIVEYVPVGGSGAQA